MVAEANHVAQRIVDRIISQTLSLQRDLNGQVHITIAPLLNRSTAPEHATQLLSDRLAVIIREVGRPHALAFHTTDEADDPSAMISPSPYLLYGEVFAIRKNDIAYWEVFYSLDEVDPTGARPRRKVWDSRQGFLIRR